MDLRRWRLPLEGRRHSRSRHCRQVSAAALAIGGLLACLLAMRHEHAGRQAGIPCRHVQTANNTLLQG